MICDICEFGTSHGMKNGPELVDRNSLEMFAEHQPCTLLKKLAILLTKIENNIHTTKVTSAMSLVVFSSSRRFFYCCY